MDNKLSKEELRKKLDGFKIEINSEENPSGYKTIDKGVYAPPEGETSDSRKNK